MSVLLLLLLCLGEVLARKDILPEVSLDAEGNFVDPDGYRMLFHGFNSVYKSAPYYNEQDISDHRLNYFRQWGFNVVRLGVLWHPSFPTGPGQVNATYLNAIERQVDRFHEAGIYVILDMHQDSLSSMYGSYDAIPTWLLQSFPQPSWFFGYPWPKRSMPLGDWQGYVTYACQKAFQCIYDNEKDAWKHWADFWVAVALRFKEKPNVLGYELMNEPFAGNIYTNPLRSIPGYAGKHNLVPVYDYLVNQIRKVDRKKFVFFEGVTWSVIASPDARSAGGPGFERVPGKDTDPTEVTRSVFSYHYYCPLIELANASAVFPTYERIACDDIIMPKMYSSVLGIARQLGSGLFLTEFGICVPDGNVNSINTIECNAVMNGADANLQSWTYWDSQFFNEEEKVVPDHVKPFARVYPLFTAGRPSTLSFSTNSGSAVYAFFTTNNTRVLGGQGKPIASIFLPIEMHYPRGYMIEIQPSSINYQISTTNDHVIEVYPGDTSLWDDMLIEFHVHAKL